MNVAPPSGFVRNYGQTIVSIVFVCVNKYTIALDCGFCWLKIFFLNYFKFVCFALQMVMFD